MKMADSLFSSQRIQIKTFPDDMSHVTRDLTRQIPWTLVQTVEL